MALLGRLPLMPRTYGPVQPGPQNAFVWRRDDSGLSALLKRSKVGFNTTTKGVPCSPTLHSRVL
jgi:hypothetical protein